MLHEVDALEETCPRGVADGQDELARAVGVGRPGHGVGDVVDHAGHGIPGLRSDDEGGRKARGAVHGDLVRPGDPESTGRKEGAAEDVVGARREAFAASELGKERLPSERRAQW